MSYERLINEEYFFAEDVIGNQYSIEEEGCFRFDAETAAKEKISSTLDGWADHILREPDLLTGRIMAATWQEEKGLLKARDRLIPLQPFVLGGEFQLANLIQIEAAEGMRRRGPLALQIHDRPEGSEVTINIVE